jgi:hypothetical protein
MGNVKDSLDVLPIIEVGGFALEEVRRMRKEQLTLIDLSLDLSSIEQVTDLGGILEVYRQLPNMVSLDCMDDLLELTAELQAQDVQLVVEQDCIAEEI